ncbi:hypothetical protein BU586_03560 [Staphylococcus agnetis]|nr:hypothetical protein BU589_00410 [Staphylococcus agnetis]PTH70603.1 hypothetical protein BU586_03560 [Staphylococcus agnetis]PTH76874.1 hypothetical protein BU579_06820 [Staphylococcus agnetis]
MSSLGFFIMIHPMFFTPLNELFYAILIHSPLLKFHAIFILFLHFLLHNQSVGNKQNMEKDVTEDDMFI